MATCEGCFFARPVNGLMQCFRYPPTAAAVVMPVPPTPSQPQGGIGVQAITVRPQVQAADTCGEFKPRLTAFK